MTCRELADFLHDYVAERLPTVQRSVFEEHLGICPDCVVYLDSYRSTVALAGSLGDDPDAATPDDVPEDLIGAILDARRRDD